MGSSAHRKIRKMFALDTALFWRLIPKGRAEYHCNAGLEYEARGDRLAAQKEYERALEIYPKHWPSLTNLGLLYQRIGENEKAYAALSRAIELRRNYYDAYLARAEVLRALGRFDEALSDCDALERLGGKNDGWPDVLRSQIHQQRGQNDSAIALADAAVKKDPTDPIYRAELADRLLEAERFEEAREAAMQALKLDPRHINAISVLGITAQREGDLELARQHFERAAAIAGKDTLILHNLAISYMQSGAWRLASIELKKVLELQPDHMEALLNLGVTYHRLGSLEEAVRVTKDLLQRAPNEPRAHYNLAAFYALQGKRKRALEELEKSFRFDSQLRDSARRDEDFTTLRDNARFKKLLQD